MDTQFYNPSITFSVNFYLSEDTLPEVLLVED